VLLLRLVAVLVGERLVEIAEDDGRGLAPVVPLGLLQLEEDVNILEWLGLGPARIRAGQEATLDLEPGVQVVAHLLLPCRGVGLLLVVELEAALELAEGLIDGEHQCFLR
jgi:hypothetical protein